MPDLSLIVDFDWDEGNSRKSLDKHGVEQSEAEQVFLDKKLLILNDDKHGGAEERFHAYGQSATGRLLLVSFTLRHDGTMLRVISARDMSRREKNRYGQET